MYFDAYQSATDVSAAYREHGFAVVRGLMPAHVLKDMRQTVQDVIKARISAQGINVNSNDIDHLYEFLCRGDRSLGGDIYRVLKSHPACLWFATAPMLTNYVRRLLGTTNQLFQTPIHFRIDRKGEGELFGVPWHQDYPYICTTDNGITVWYAITDVTEDMGPMQVMPGSHTHGMCPTRIDKNYKVKWDHQKIFSMVYPPYDSDPGIISLPVKAGDVVFMHAMTVHRSGTNTTDRNRWSVVTRYDDLLNPEFVARGWRNGIDGPTRHLAVMETENAKCIVNRDEVVEA